MTPDANAEPIGAPGVEGGETRTSHDKSRDLSGDFDRGGDHRSVGQTGREVGHESGKGEGDGVPPWRSFRAWGVFLSTILIGFTVDIWSKYYAFANIADAPVVFTREEAVANTRQLGLLLPFHDPVVAIPGVLEFTLVLNPGAVFGIGAGQRVFFIVATFVAMVFGVVIFAFSTRRKDWIAHVALGLLLAGGLGNLYDRVFYGCVRDFIHPLPRLNLPMGWSWPWGGREVWPYVSNVADLFLLIGIGVLLVHAWRHELKQHRAAKAAGATGDSSA
jgi:signal peptidase II